MATVKFRIKNQPKGEVSISVYLSIAKGDLYQCKTGFIINPKDWKANSKRRAVKKVGQYIIGVPKQNDETNKKLFNDLQKLETNLYKELNKSQSKGDLIDRYWLEETISATFNRKSKVEEGLLTNQVQHIIDGASTRQVLGRKELGISKSRVNAYKTFKKILLNFQAYHKKPIYFIDINKRLVDKFRVWLLDEMTYGVNHAGKQLDILKTVCMDAVSSEIEVNPYVVNIKGFRKDKQDVYIEILSEEELLIIRNKTITKNYLINARKWLLIGCYIGQRGSDLLSITKDNIRYNDGNTYIDVTQKKTKKDVSVPVLPPIKDLIEKDLPTKISTQKFNKYLKELCKECGIDEIKEGEKFHAKTKRKEFGKYPKYELITSHCCRRSFATNFYKKIPTPVLIQITGHSTESLFLDYIAKPRDKDENAKLLLRLFNEVQKDKPKKLKVVG